MNLLATVAGTPRLAGAQDCVAEARAVERGCQFVMERVEDDGYAERLTGRQHLCERPALVVLDREPATGVGR